MPRVFVFVLFALFFAGFVHADRAASLGEAKSLSASTGKPILMDFMTEW
jgi:hypothetical protein